MKWEMTGEWIIMKRFGVASIRVQVKAPSDYGIGDWKYKWRWAKVEEIHKLNLSLSSFKL